MAIYFMILHALEPKKKQRPQGKLVQLAFSREPEVTSTAAKQNQ